MKHSVDTPFSRIVRNLILLVAVVVVVFPYFWITMASLKPPELVARPDVWLFSPVWDNWHEVLFESDVPHNLLNSILVGTLTVTLALFTGSPAAYSFSRFRTGGATVRFAILIAQMVPPAVLIIPLFLIMYHARMLDTLWAVVMAHLTFVLPMVTWFLIGFFDEVPRDLEEQAMVDGCTHFQAFYRVVLPVVRPGLAASAIFGFVLSWNDMFYSLLLTGGKAKTLPAAIAGFWTFRGIELGKMSVAVMIAILPVLVASFFIQRYLVKGMGAGAIK